MALSTVVLSVIGVAVSPVTLYLAARFMRARQLAGPVVNKLIATGAVCCCVVVGFAASVSSPLPQAAVIAVALWLLVAAAVVDGKVRLLPDRFTLPAAGVVLIGFGVIAALDGAAAGWLRSLGGAALLGGALLVMGLATGAVGLGDVKASIAVGGILAWLGWASWFAGVLLGLLLLVATAAVLAARDDGERRGRMDDRSLPYGPALVAGAVAALLLHGLT